MKCFYHEDLDGQASAFCVHAWAGVRNPHEADKCMYAIHYGQSFPFEDILPREQVWIVDYSVSPDEMLRLLDITKNVTWIDHHKTAIEKYADFPRLIRGIRQNGEAACTLTFKYLNWWTARGEGPERYSMGDPMPLNGSDAMPVPRMLKLVGDRDVWRWAFKDETRFFFAGSQMHDTRPDSEFWWKCMEHEVDLSSPPNTGNAVVRARGEVFWEQLLRDGQTIEKYKAQSDEGTNGLIGYEVAFEGYRCFACNRARVSSDRFGERIKQYDILLPHYHDGKQWTVSLYSEKVDVSEIAKKHGGGGHTGAAGFQCAVLPWAP